MNPRNEPKRCDDSHSTMGSSLLQVLHRHVPGDEHRAGVGDAGRFETLLLLQGRAG